MGLMWIAGAVAGWIVAGFVMNNFILKGDYENIMAGAQQFAQNEQNRKAAYVRMSLTNGPD